MTYKLYKNAYGELSCVICLEKEISIPFDPDNTDYQAYLKWLDEGNVPLSADTNTPEPADGGTE